MITELVFSVPTRDWNQDAMGATEQIFKFLAYLRGIETLMNEQNMTKVLEFLAYLRGIETYIALEWTENGERVFSVPTRDWNVDERTEHDKGFGVFSVPTRDWNKYGSTTSFRILSVFSVPTRDWNVRLDTAAATTAVSF